MKGMVNMKTIVRRIVTPLQAGESYATLNCRRLGKFIEEDNQLYCLDNEGKNKELIANFIVTFTQQISIIKIDGSVESLLKVEAYTPLLANVICEDIAVSDFNDIDEILLSKYLYLIITPGRNSRGLFAEYIRTIYSLCMNQYDFYHEKYNVTGWFLPNNGSWHYFSGADWNCLSNRILVNPPRINTHCAIMDALEILKIGEFSAMWPLFLQLHIGTLFSLFSSISDSVSVDYIMALTAPTGSGKTAICRELFCHFGNSNIVNLATSTEYGIERVAAESKDLTIVLDDLFSANNKNLIEKFLFFLDQYGDTTGRVKGCNYSSNGYERVAFQCGVVMTTECNHDILQQSRKLRILVVPMKSGTVDFQMLERFSIDRKSGKFSIIEIYISAFIRFVEKNCVEVMNIIMQSDNDEFICKFARQQKIYRILRCCMQIIFRFYSEHNINMPFSWEFCISTIQNLIRYNEALCSEDEPHIFYLKTVMLGILQNELFIADSRKEYLSPTKYARYFGFEDGELLYLDPNMTYNFVLLKCRNNNFPATPRDIWCRLRDDGISVCYGEKNHIAKPLKKIKLGEISADILCLDKKKVNCILEKF